MLVRTVECIDGPVEIELVCEPVFDYGRDGSRVDPRRRRPADGRRDRRRPDDPPLSDLALGIEGSRVRGRHMLSRRAGLLRALLGRGARRAEGLDEAEARMARRRVSGATGSGGLGSPTTAFRERPTLGARDQGPDLHAHRRDRRGPDDIVARDAGRRAQLGLPVHLDARHDVHAAGAPLAQPRLGGRRVHGVRRRPRADRGRVAPDHVRDRRPARPDGVDARPSLRVCGRASRPDR